MKLVLSLIFTLTVCLIGADFTFPIVGTNVTKFYDNSKSISEPQPGDAFYGQDAHYIKNVPAYTNNGDGTITDNVTSLMWEKAYQVISNDEALAMADTCKTGGYADWRIPTIKELYSLILFSGTDVSSGNMTDIPEGAIPFIDTTYFDFEYGSNGDRVIDVQLLSSTKYTSTTMNGAETVFGVNIADGRIKGYPLKDPRSQAGKLFTVRLVRGNNKYGINKFGTNDDGTITDSATGLMWTKNDFGKEGDTGPRSGMIWEDALSLAQQKNKETLLGYKDWRLPDAKELQSIIDYTRGPDETKSAAIDPIFNSTQITNEGSNADFPWYWSSSTHAKSNGMGDNADYFCFGRGLGYFMNSWNDVHGAGAQRSDQKSNDFSKYTYVDDGYYFQMAPQGDAVRLYNYVRLVRDAGMFTTPVNKKSGLSGPMELQIGFESTGSAGTHFLISLTLESMQQIQLDIHDAVGRSVVGNTQKIMQAGKNSFMVQSSYLKNGIYFVTIIHIR
ncbi:MAG: DUF1566 domain-containing protein, partial [Fibrobacteria bacterium]|nr:DUF1566 domain-containing protein [Fibrobacteria bacterium]